MTHYGKLGNMEIEIEIKCIHPEGIEDGCPTRCGNCESCRYSKATLPTEQILALVEAAGVKNAY